jgi:hypothetical protein
MYCVHSDTKKMSFPRVKGPIPGARTLHMAAELPSRMLILGGVMTVEESKDYFGDMFTLNITRGWYIMYSGFALNFLFLATLTLFQLLVDACSVPDFGTDDDDDKKIRGRIDALLHPIDALASKDPSLAEVAEIYKQRFPEKAGNANRAVDFEKKLEAGFMNMKVAEMAVAKKKFAKSLKNSLAPTNLLASPQDEQEDEHKQQAAFQQGMEVGLSIQQSLQEAELSGQLKSLFDPEKSHEMQIRPEVVQMRRELAEATAHFEQRVQSDPALLQQLDRALREAEDGLIQKANSDSSILEQAKKALESQGPAIGVEQVNFQLQNLAKSDLAINAYKEMTLARITHLLRMLDNPTTASMLMSTIQRMPDAGGGGGGGDIGGNGFGSGTQPLGPQQPIDFMQMLMSGLAGVASSEQQLQLSGSSIQALMSPMLQASLRQDQRMQIGQTFSTPTIVP